MSRNGNIVFGIIKSRVRLRVGFVLDFLSRILRIILRGRKSLKSILNILNLECIPAYAGQGFSQRSIGWKLAQAGLENA